MGHMAAACYRESSVATFERGYREMRCRLLRRSQKQDGKLVIVTVKCNREFRTNTNTYHGYEFKRWRG